MYIEVDHGQLVSAASDIDSFVEFYNTQMTSIDTEVESILQVDWKGDDAAYFINMWNTIMDEDSTYKKTVDALEQYAEMLRTAANKYMRAQGTSVDESLLLEIL